MSEQRYLFYSDGDRGPCFFPWYPTLLQLAPRWFRGNDKGGGRVEVGSYSWPADDIPPTEVYRDNLRNGWHVVPEGVRYVAVKGIKAGQRVAACSSEAIARMLQQQPQNAASWK